MPRRSKAHPKRSGFHVTLRMETAEAAPALRRWLLPRFRRLAAMAGVRAGQLTLVVVGDREMSRLHRTFTGISGTTDVLTFDLRDAPGASGHPLEGDVVICLDEAARQAGLRGHPVRLEVLLYALHGLLHLLGYDDHTPADHARMHRREDQILTAAGLGPVYAAAARPRR